MTSPKISILTPSFNHERFIGAFIESVLNQTFTDFELIIVDDCSSDENVKKILEFKDERIKLVQHPFNQGINASLNTAFEHSSGELVVFLAGDDMFLPNALERIYESFMRQNCVALYNKLIQVDVYGNKTGNISASLELSREQMLHTIFMRSNVLVSPGLTLKRKTFEEILYPLDNAICNLQDVQMHIEILYAGEIYRMQEPLVLYRYDERASNISANNATTKTREKLEIDSLMDTFLQIQDVALLQRIFSNEIAQTQIQPTLESIEYFLGRMALLSPDRARQEWGYRKIMSAYSTKEKAQNLKALYGFEFKDYLKIASLLSDDKYYKKYKKYKKALNISLSFLVIFLVLIVVLILRG